MSDCNVCTQTLASHIAVLGRTMSGRGRSLCTESSTPLSSHNQRIPGIPAGPAQISNSELTWLEDFWSGGSLGNCSLRSNSYQLTAPGKLSSQAARSQAGRTDIVFSYTSCFRFKTDHGLSSPTSVCPWCRFRKCLSLFVLFHIVAYSLGCSMESACWETIFPYRQENDLMWLFFYRTLILILRSSSKLCICV